MTAGSARAGRCTEACSASHAPRSPLAPTCAERPASPHRLLGCAGAWPRARRRPSLDVQLRALCAAVLGLCFRVVGARGCAAAVPAGVLLARRLSRAGPTAHRVRPVVVGPRRVGRALLSRPLGSWRGRHAEAAELSRAVAGSAVALGGFLCCGWAMATMAPTPLPDVTPLVLRARPPPVELSESLPSPAAPSARCE